MSCRYTRSSFARVSGGYAHSHAANIFRVCARARGIVTSIRAVGSLKARLTLGIADDAKAESAVGFRPEGIRNAVLTGVWIVDQR